VNESRNINAPLFVTVLCACLGLLVTGVSAEANAPRTVVEVAHYGTSSIRLSLAASTVSSFQVLNIDDRRASEFTVWSERTIDPLPLNRTQAHPAIDQVLVLTCLPRAALSTDSPAKPFEAI
jgi:hypothetical protein